MENEIFELLGNQGYDVSLDGNIITVLNADTKQAWHITVTPA